MLLASIKICQNCIPLPRFSIIWNNKKTKLEVENSEIRIDYIATKCLKTKIKVWIYFSQYIPIFIIACLDPVNKTKIAMFIRFLFF